MCFIDKLSYNYDDDMKIDQNINDASNLLTLSLALEVQLVYTKINYF